MHLSLSDIPHHLYYKRGNWSTITSAVLLDQHQEVLDTPSEGNTLPHR